MASVIRGADNFDTSVEFGGIGMGNNTRIYVPVASVNYVVPMGHVTTTYIPDWVTVDLPTGKFTILESGVYKVSFTASVKQGELGTTIYIRILLNGNVIADSLSRAYDSVATYNQNNVERVLNINAGDTIQGSFNFASLLSFSASGHHVLNIVRLR